MEAEPLFKVADVAVIITARIYRDWENDSAVGFRVLEMITLI